MDRNTGIGLLLIAILLVVFMQYNNKQAAKQREENKAKKEKELERQDSIRKANQTVIIDSIPQETVNLEDSLKEIQDSIALELQRTAYGPFFSNLDGEEQVVTLENELLKVEFSSKGAQIRDLQLKDYLDFSKNPVHLIKDGLSDFSLGLYTTGSQEPVNTSNLYFNVEQTGETVVFTAGEEGKEIRFEYGFRKDDKHLIQLNITSRNMDGFLRTAEYPLNLSWEADMILQERNVSSSQDDVTIFYNSEDDIDRLSWRSEDEELVKTPITWLAFRQAFFNIKLTPSRPFNRADLEIKVYDPDKVTDRLKHFTADMELSREATDLNLGLEFFFGPNRYSLLKGYDDGSADLVTFGHWSLSWVNKWIVLPIFKLLSNITSNYGIIIFLLALFIKIILTPLTFRSYKSQAKMKVLKPEINELKEKYKDDNGKFQQEQLKLYRKTGVSPFGGCLPMLLQFPILIALYRFFPNSIELRQSGFLWADDLSSYDSIATLPFDIPFYGDHVSLFTLLMAASSLLYARLNSQTTMVEGPMKYMQYFMPFMLIFIFNSFASGLTYYYFLYNILSFGQTFLFQRFLIDEDKIRKQIEINKKKPKKKSKFMQRLEDASKAQEARKKALQQKRKKKR